MFAWVAAKENRKDRTRIYAQDNPRIRSFSCCFERIVALCLRDHPICAAGKAGSTDRTERKRSAKERRFLAGATSAHAHAGTYARARARAHRVLHRMDERHAGVYRGG